SFQAANLLQVLDVPQANHMVLRPGGDQLAVGRKGGTLPSYGVSRRGDQFARVEVPEPEFAIIPRRCNHPAVGGDSHADDFICVPFQLLHLLTGGSIPNMDESVPRAAQQFGPVWTDSYAVYLSALARQSIDFLTGRDVPIACSAVCLAASR